MAGTLYIPKTLLVGFQERTDTFTGKLAYVIYKDHTGKIRKEASWNGWRDHKLETLEIENVPTPNFTLNKGVQRSREWFGTGRSMVRVWDPRDFEFEITVDNLLNVLMHADVSKRDITEPCVYAWQGTNLVLLPTNSVEYQESLAHTEKQGVKTSAKDLGIGYTYSIKRDSTTRVVYLGRYDRFEVERDYATGVTSQKQKPKKYHVFMDEKTREVYARDPSALIAACISDEVHPDYASMMDTYYSSAESQPVVGLMTSASTDRHGYYGLWFKIGNEFVRLRCSEEHRPLPKQPGEQYAKQETYMRVTADDFATYDEVTKQRREAYEQRNNSYYSSRPSTPVYPGALRPTTPEVVELIAKVQGVAEQYIYDRQMYGWDWEKSNAVEKERAKAINDQIGGGCLAFVLADGKIAKDHQL